MLLLLIGTGFFLKRSKNLNKKVELIDRIIDETIAEYDIESSDISEEVYETKQEGKFVYTYIKKVYRLKDNSVEFKDIRRDLNERLKKAKAYVARSHFSYNKDDHLAFFDIEYCGLKVYTLNLSFKKSLVCKIAIVLDDWGYNLTTLDMVWNLDIPITFSIIPNLPYSTRISNEVFQKKHEVILHLPMESYESIAVEKYVIKTKMNKNQIIKIFEKSLKTVPKAKGISNHMGSKAMEDGKLLMMLFPEIKKKNLYFLDNLVTDNSKAEDIARNVDIRFAKRSVFLDNESDFDYIKNQVQELVALAKTTGSSIGVGHDRMNTLKALERIIPELKEENIEFVYVSEIVK